MANGYGSSSGSSSSSTQRTSGSSSSSMQRTTNAQGQVAPPGFHYMPNGTLMSDAEHARLYGKKTISSFNLDFSDLAAAGETRPFTITGEAGVQFKLDVKDNTTGYYYNFVTNVFQAAQASLQETLVGNSYAGKIVFPTITGSDDQYDVYLYALPGTVHTKYSEVRFGDGSIDINSSTGSDSLMIQKVIYQYAALTLTLQGFSIGSTVAGTAATDTISIDRGKSKPKTAFSCTVTAAATAAYRILKQPVAGDVIAFLEPVIGSAPITLPGENIYPEVSNTDTVDGDFTAGTSTKIVMDTNVANKMVVGDKITIATADATDTVDGAVSSSNRIVMDNNVITKMSVGDRVTGTGIADTAIVTVTHLNPDSDNAKELQVSEAVSISDGVTLTFSPKCNRELFTVAALNPDEDNVKEFSYVDANGTTDTRFGVRDGATLSFSNQMNYSWPVNNYANILRENMIVLPSTNVSAGTAVGKYEDSITIFEGTKKEEKIIKNQRPAISTLGKKPTVVKNLVTVQEGQIVFDRQQVLALANNTLKVGGHGEEEISRVYGWDVKFTNLAIALTAPTTTTTEATSAHATIAVADREGVINNFSRVSGIGIDASLESPLITSGGGADGAGDWVMDATQTLENGITLTVENTGRIATITGDIEIIKAGTASQTLRFDINKLLSTS